MRRLLTTLVRATSVRDVALVVVLMGVAVAEIAADWGDNGAGRVAYAGLVVVGLLVRRRLPLLAAAGVSVGLVAESLLLESPEETGVLLAVIVAAFSLASYSEPRDTATGAVLLVMAVATATAVDPSDSITNILPNLLLFVGLPLGLGLTVRRRQRDLATLRLKAVANADEAAEAVAAERRRIARELHDVVSHAVTLVAVQAEAGRSVIDRDPAAAARNLGAIADASRDALVELDRMLHVLRAADGTVVDTHAGLSRVPALVEGARSAGLTVEVAADPELARRAGLSGDVEACAFRVVQEGLTNALRHAPGSRVQVFVETLADQLLIEVRTSGRRRSSSYGGGRRGLVGLRERVVSLGGTLETDASANGDFVLRVSLPGRAA